MARGGIRSCPSGRALSCDRDAGKSWGDLGNTIKITPNMSPDHGPMAAYGAPSVAISRPTEQKACGRENRRSEAENAWWRRILPACFDHAKPAFGGRLSFSVITILSCKNCVPIDRPSIDNSVHTPQSETWRTGTSPGVETAQRRSRDSRCHLRTCLRSPKRSRPGRLDRRLQYGGPDECAAE